MDSRYWPLYAVLLVPFYVFVVGIVAAVAWWLA